MAMNVLNRADTAPAGVALIAAIATLPRLCQADEGGVSFWLPGQYASLIAVPQEPGWSFGAIYYHASFQSDADETFPQGAQIRVGLEGSAHLAVLSPTYVFAEPLLGGQASLGVAGVFGYSEASVDATLVGPQGQTLSGGERDSRWGVGDLYPTASLRWNQGVHSYMVYASGDIPVGDYDPDRLANFGIGHAALDGGAGYTYFNPKTGREFSALAGLTYNFENPDTDYRNGVDGHIDWGASQFLSEQLQIGIAGYIYQQLTGDSGVGAKLGDFKSRVLGIGPQISYLFPVGALQGFFNARGYYEFDAEHRPSGWNVLVTFAVSPAPREPNH